MKEIVILNSIEDAEDCILHQRQKNRDIFTTHASVNIYLKEMYNIEAKYISSFFSDSEIVSYKAAFANKVEQILLALDANITPQINEKFNLKMRYFWPLYSYLGKMHFRALFFFTEGLRRVIDVTKSKKILAYNRKVNFFVDGITDVGCLVSAFVDNLETEIISLDPPRKSETAQARRTSPLLKQLFRRPIYSLKMISNGIENNIRLRGFSTKASTIVLHESLNHLRFLKKKLRGYNIFYYPRSDTAGAPVGFKNAGHGINLDVDFKEFDFVSDKGSPFVDAFLEDIKADFTKNIRGYIPAITGLRSASEKYPISLAIWGSPPFKGRKALIFEYLSSQGVKILGAQHGNIYGEQVVPSHFDSDYNRCDYFVSYGFTQENLSKLHPRLDPRCTILPYGASKLVKYSPRKEIDILFPITNVFSILHKGMSRIPPHKLAISQVKLLEHLDSLIGYSVIVKPFKSANFNSCAPLIVLKRLKRLRLIDDVTLKEFLEEYHPRAVIIEYPSSPLLDCLHLDTEIFLMNDTIRPYGKDQLEALRRRVHYSENVEEIIEKMNMFLKGELEKKRDDTFLQRYVYGYGDRREERILKKIQELVSERSHCD